MIVYPIQYRILKQQIFSFGKYSIVPIRSNDRFEIMKWRNEQLYHLRQSKPLTEEDQNIYFNSVLNKLFEQEQPNQILFSYMEDEVCIGYGGLVHINWIDQNAEISFIMNTALEKLFFHFHWQTYLHLIEIVAFKELKLHKIYTYAFDLRPHLYDALENSGYIKEAILKEHCLIEKEYKSVVIHTKKRTDLFLRDARIEDVNLTYNWAIHPDTRKYSFNPNIFTFEKHQTWYSNKLIDSNCFFKILMKGEEELGSVRIDIDKSFGIISYLISPEHYGKGYATYMLTLLLESLKKNKKNIKNLKGLVKKENIASEKIFSKLGFQKTENGEGMLEFSLNL